ncbi:GNAT family N-acetyltransferase [Aeromicrobium sp. UC242_57]|uniref:GNAT family N-acetyltransferase n=1 Tax=Aeromicrobium sp. UC242_57 TaxID=3374624 RepID=UPI0037A4A91E
MSASDLPLDTALPIDEISRARLESDGLRLALVDAHDQDAYESWFRVESRGFHDGEPTPEHIAWRRTFPFDGNRVTGVFDDTIANPHAPVATTVCWPAELTVPGGRSVSSWAVSGVSVAPTHRRRGIARALMEAELRTASALGQPVAMLTVSESTLYGRYGYSPAALARDVTVVTKRARWTGPQPTGRVHFLTAEQLREVGHEIVERVRLRTPGQISYSGLLWERQLGFSPSDQHAKRLRFIRYDDADGTPQGFAVYRLVENADDFTQHELVLQTLVAATTDAYAGLWRFLIEMDLVAKVSAHLRPVDESLRWMLDDFRAVQVSEFDHLWVRVLDVAAALSARTYARADRIVLKVTDPLGFADGTWLLDVSASGSATVTPSDEPADATLSVNALGSLYLGGATAHHLAATGALTGDAERLDGLFRSPVEPYLSIWF